MKSSRKGKYALVLSESEMETIEYSLLYRIEGTYRCSDHENFGEWCDCNYKLLGLTRDFCAAMSNESFFESTINSIEAYYKKEEAQKVCLRSDGEWLPSKAEIDLGGSEFPNTSVELYRWRDGLNTGDFCMIRDGTIKAKIIHLYTIEGDIDKFVDLKLCATNSELVAYRVSKLTPVIKAIRGVYTQIRKNETKEEKNV